MRGMERKILSTGEAGRGLPWGGLPVVVAALCMTVLSPQVLPARAQDLAGGIGAIADEVIGKHMREKEIPGLSLAVVYRGKLVFSRGYGDARLAPRLKAGPGSVYPISSVSKIVAGVVTMRLVSQGKLSLDDSIAMYLEDVPADKRGITIRHLLQHTHGLDDFYRSDDYRKETGTEVNDSPVDELIRWSLQRPLVSAPGEKWAYSLAGYVILGRILERVSGQDYVGLVEQEVFRPLGISATYGGSEVLVQDRHPLLYEMHDGKVDAHPVDFPPFVYAAGGLNISVDELAKLFIALSADNFLSSDARDQLWQEVTLADGTKGHYALGWFSYTTSRDRWVVGHEGGGAAWVIYYPARQLAVLALSNLSGARADSLPYEIARAGFAKGLFD